MSGCTPLVVFGAFDRHNFGDLLFAHVAQALLPGRRLRFAGLVDRDLREWGGHRIEALTRVAHSLQGQRWDLLHAGGELLTCSAREAAVMLLDAGRAQALLRGGAEPEPLPEEFGKLPYLAAQPLLGDQVHIYFNAVGGVALDQLAAPLRTEALDKLRHAEWIGVREQTTLSVLNDAGLAARLLPDPAALVEQLFGARIARHIQQGEPARVRGRFPEGYLAVQCSTEFDDDATLDTLASQLDEIGGGSGFVPGITLFRAGAAPWHDSLELYRRLGARLNTPVHVFYGMNLWDICAVIAGSRGYCGSSLHGRIVASAYALPRINIAAREVEVIGKQSAYAATWDTGMPGCVPLQDLACAMREALAAPREFLQARARDVAASYRERVEELKALLE